MNEACAVKKKKLTVAGNLSFVMLFTAAMAVSELYPPGGSASRRRSLKVLTSVGNRVAFRFPVRWRPTPGGTGVARMAEWLPLGVRSCPSGWSFQDSLIIAIAITHYLWVRACALGRDQRRRSRWLRVPSHCNNIVSATSQSTGEDRDSQRDEDVGWTMACAIVHPSSASYQGRTYGSVDVGCQSNRDR